MARRPSPLTLFDLVLFLALARAWPLLKRMESNESMDLLGEEGEEVLLLLL